MINSIHDPLFFLKCDKCIIKRFSNDHASEFHTLINNENVVKTMSSRWKLPFTMDKVLSFIKESNQIIQFGNNDQLKLVKASFAVEIDGHICGSIGLHPVQLAPIGMHPKSTENQSENNYVLGYFFGEDYWGRGIASDCVMNLMRFISEQESLVKIQKIEATTITNNIASSKVLLKSGFEFQRLVNSTADTPELNLYIKTF